ncbi:hypothetical protein M9458_006713, partial [Cirrhinus mrigala]
VANSTVLSVAVPIILPSTGRSSAASLDGEGERENGEKESSVSPRESPMSPRPLPTTLADDLGSGIPGFDSQVKRSPSEKMSDHHSPSGSEEEEKDENEMEKSERRFSGSPDVEEATRSGINIKEDEEEDKEVVSDEEEEETGVSLVPSSVTPDLTTQIEDEHETPSHLPMTPEEAKKRGLSFDYTEPHDLGQHGGPVGWECSSDKTPPESKSPDSCRADPGSPLSPIATEPTQEESSLTDYQTDAREEEEEAPEPEQEEEATTIPPTSQEFAAPKIEPKAEEHREPEEAKEIKQEKYLETSDDDRIDTEKVQAVATPEPVAKTQPEAKDAVKPSAQVTPTTAPSKAAPVKESPAKKTKKPVATVAATPSPKSAPKLQKTPSKDAAPARKASVPSKGLFFPFCSSKPLTDLLYFTFPFLLFKVDQ